MVQYFAAVFGDQDQVFDSYADAARDLVELALASDTPAEQLAGDETSQAIIVRSKPTFRCMVLPHLVFSRRSRSGMRGCDSLRPSG